MSDKDLNQNNSSEDRRPVKPSRVNPRETQYRRPVKPQAANQSSSDRRGIDLSKISDETRVVPRVDDSLRQAKELDVSRNYDAKSANEPIKPLRDFELQEENPETASELLGDKLGETTSFIFSSMGNEDADDIDEDIKEYNIGTRDRQRSSDDIPTDNTHRVPIVSADMKSVGEVDVPSISTDSSNRSVSSRTSNAVKVSYKEDKKANSGDQVIIRNAAKLTILESANKPIPWWNRIQRRGPSKEYRLRGFANKEYAKKVRRRKKTFAFWANIVFWIIMAILIIMLYNWIDPFTRISEYRGLLGLD